MYLRRGFEAILTPASRDKGVDVYVIRHEEFGSTLTIVQCKRYSPTNKVGVATVRELYGVVEDTAASKGALVTTSFLRLALEALRTTTATDSHCTITSRYRTCSTLGHGQRDVTHPGTQNADYATRQTWTSSTHAARSCCLRFRSYSRIRGGRVECR